MIDRTSIESILQSHESQEYGGSPWTFERWEIIWDRAS